MLPASDPPLIQENEVWGFFLAKSQAPTLTKHSLPLSAFFFFFFWCACVYKSGEAWLLSKA